MGGPDYADLIERAPAGYLVIDPKGRIEHINRTGATILGWEPAGMAGEPFSRWIVQADRALLGSLQHRLETSTVPVTQPLRAKNRQGRVLYLRLECLRKPQSAGAWRAIMIDVSSEQLSARRLHDLQSRLAQLGRLNTAGEMATSLAHELNQPLGTILLHCDATLRMLRSGTASAAELLDAVGQTREPAVFATGVIRHLRSFLRNAAEPHAVCDLRTLVQEVARLIETDLCDHDIDLDIELETALPPVSVDTVQIEQVLLNLLHNGIQAIGSGSGGGERRITVCVASEGPDRVRATIEDTGPGLAPPELQRIFTPFYTTKPDGMGMGLSISRSIIEAHGGSLWAEPDRARGAVFHFTLPAAGAA